MGYLQSKSFVDLCEQRHAPYIRDRRASQGLLGRVAPSGGARQGPIAGYVLQTTLTDPMMIDVWPPQPRTGDTGEGGGGSGNFSYYLRAVEDCHSRFLENGWSNTYF